MLKKNVFQLAQPIAGVLGFVVCEKDVIDKTIQHNAVKKQVTREYAIILVFYYFLRE